MGENEIVRATGVVKRYQTEAEELRVLDGLNLTVQRGEFIAITGRSGSGKTTLLNCLSGLDDIDEGSVTIDGIDLASADDAARTAQRSALMSFVFQSSDLLPVFTALDNAALPMVLGGVPTRRARERAAKALERVGLGARMQHAPHQLSGGEQQRVAIARAFAKQPEIVWADEPTGNLDTHTAGDMIALLREFHSDGVTLVLVTHDRELALLADRQVEVRDGRIATETLA